MLWKQSLREALTTTDQLKVFFDHDFIATPYPILIPLGLAKKIRNAGLDSPLARQFLPNQQEHIQTKGLRDPIGDLSHKKGTCAVHRYKNRILFLPTTHCPVRCRFCFRKNILAADGPFAAGATPDREFFNYLSDHPEIEEVIFTGGDPFMLDDQKLQSYL
ncbi:MAG: 4Fe-4S cluster-binding domain-containing protein, partial [Bdellovibrionota bacterium]